MISHAPNLRRKRSGFTLIEVSLAVLVLGLGLMAAFGLFPAGVRQNEESIADTRAALFADYVLNGMQANAATITDWSQWRDDGYSRILGNSGSPACPNDTSLPNVVANVASSIVPITWPSTSTQKLRYRLTMGAYSGNHVYTAMLEVKDLDDGSAFDPPDGVPDGVFYTEFVFKGM